MILIVASWLFFHWESQSGPELWKNFGAIIQRVSPKICVSRQMTKVETERGQFAWARSRKPTKGGDPAKSPKGRRRSHGGTWRFMTSANLGESWSSKQEPLVATISFVLELSHPHDHSWRTFQDLSFKDIRETESHRRRRTKKPRSKRSREAIMSGIMPNWQPSSWSWQQPTTWTRLYLHLGNSGART